MEVTKDRVWTAKEDSRHLSPWIGLPGYRHTVGMARHWHFLSVLFWVGNGLLFVLLLFGSGQWKRLVPMSFQIVPDAWNVFVHYATLHLPLEPNGFYRFNALQQLSYFGVMGGALGISGVRSTLDGTAEEEGSRMLTLTPKFA